MRPRPETLVEIRAARDALARELGRPPSMGEIGRRTKFSRARVHMVLTAAGESTTDYAEWKRDADAATREILLPEVPETAAQLLAANVRRLLEAKGIAESDFAVAIGIPGPSYVAAKTLRGDFLYAWDPTWPKADRVDRMARVLEVPRSELLREVSEWPTGHGG